MGTNSYVTKLKAQLDQAIIQRDHWKQLAENRNSIVVTEVCPESRSVEEYIIDADSVRASWRLIRGYREQIEALRLQNAMFTTAAANINREREAMHAEAEALRAENARLRAVLAEQGERQGAVAYAIGEPDGSISHLGAIYYTKAGADRHIDSYKGALVASVIPLYTTLQPSQDVRALAASLYQACGAYDMPERILDALSAAANGEPFAHMIDGLLPCVPPSDQDVQSLVEALEECAASLAWNCFGECRAVHAGPIMPAAMALEAARTALAAHRQAQRPA